MTPSVVFPAPRCIQICQRGCKSGCSYICSAWRPSTIKLSEGTQFDNPYSMNVIEICPVGALTSPDFRFKSRVWDMSFNDSISFADSTGSNTKLGVRNNEILRVQPRTNMYVNKYWLSDDARLNHYEFA